MNQREGVYTAVVAVLGSNHGKVDWDTLPKSQKQEIFDLLEHGFVAGEIELKGERPRDWIKKYIPGLVNNWVRKDERLNGGGKYVTKNPGSRTGSGDATLIHLKRLLEATTNPEAKEAISAEIEKRKAELAPKPKEIDISVIPEHLRKFVPPGVTIRSKSE